MAHVAQQANIVQLKAEAHVRAAIRIAETEADKSIFVSSDAVDKWVRSWGADKELPAPQADIAPRREL